MTQKIGGTVVNQKDRDGLSFDSVATYPGICAVTFAGTSSAGSAVALGTRLYLPFRGSVVGLSYYGAASATYQATKNGVDVGSSSTGSSGQVAFRRGSIPVKEGDYLQVTGNSATGSASLAATLFLVLDPVKTI